MYYYEIYVENSTNTYTYKSEDKYEVGEWCIVNFVNRNKMGLIISETEEKDITIDISKIKPVSGRAPVLSIPKDIMELVKWIKGYYISDYNSVVKAVYPGTLKLNYSKRAIYAGSLPERMTGGKARDKVKGGLGLLEGIEEGGSMSESETSRFNGYMFKKKEVTLATLEKNFSAGIIKRAIREGSIIIEKKPIMKSKAEKTQKPSDSFRAEDRILTDEQINAAEKIRSGAKKIYLLKGVTGSGKTEVYINLIKEAFRTGHGSIFLVPEISLTAQMTERLSAEFGENIAILHSKLTDLEKRREWAHIRNGSKRIVIGARSAIFAPVENLKYIIVDEEHESSYKQESNPRYHTKNVAIKRALLTEGAKVIFGSATPSFESYYQAEEGDLELVELKERYNNARLPSYEIVDMKDTAENLSKELLTELSHVLGRNEQAILVLNRKAFANFIKCNDCGHIPVCPNCSISLSYYKYDNRLKCSYCGYERVFDGRCEACHGDRLIQIGTGTERIEEELRHFFPESRIVRVDSESVRTKKDYEDVYNDFREHKYDIMLGTQIIAKGFHFPDVTLVGIVNSDIILNFPDFRAGEKTFQLLLQSAGRAGRGEKEGKVFIQTFNSENEVIRNTVIDDYEGYYRKEMELRKMLNYPPFGRLIIIVLSAGEEEGLEEKAGIFYRMLSLQLEGIMGQGSGGFVSAPFKAPLYKINGRFRYQIFMKFSREDIPKVKKAIRRVMASYKERKIRISIDVDPVSMM